MNDIALIQKKYPGITLFSTFESLHQQCKYLNKIHGEKSSFVFSARTKERFETNLLYFSKKRKATLLGVSYTTIGKEKYYHGLMLKDRENDINGEYEIAESLEEGHFNSTGMWVSDLDQKEYKKAILSIVSETDTNKRTEVFKSVLATYSSRIPELFQAAVDIISKYHQKSSVKYDIEKDEIGDDSGKDFTNSSGGVNWRAIGKSAGGKLFQGKVVSIPKLLEAVIDEGYSAQQIELIIKELNLYV